MESLWVGAKGVPSTMELPAMMRREISEAEFWPVVVRDSPRRNSARRSSARREPSSLEMLRPETIAIRLGVEEAILGTEGDLDAPLANSAVLSERSHR